MLFDYGNLARTNIGLSKTARHDWYQDKNSKGVTCACQSEDVLLTVGEHHVFVEIILDLVKR